MYHARAPAADRAFGIHHRDGPGIVELGNIRVVPKGKGFGHDLQIIGDAGALCNPEAPRWAVGQCRGWPAAGSGRAFGRLPE